MSPLILSYCVCVCVFFPLAEPKAASGEEQHPGAVGPAGGGPDDARSGGGSGLPHGGHERSNARRNEGPRGPRGRHEGSPRLQRSVSAQTRPGTAVAFILLSLSLSLSLLLAHTSRIAHR